MRFRWAVLGIALLAAGAAVAVAAAVTTGTVSACATVTAASHTLAVDGTPVSTVGGDVATKCVTTTYTIPTVTVTVGGTTTTTPTTTTTTTTPTPTTVANPIGAICYGGCLKTFSNLGGYSMALGSSWSSDATTLQSFHGTSLTYFDGTDVAVNYSTGVPLTQAQANGWLLKDSSGNYLRNSTFGDYCADVGSTGYQQAWNTNVLAYLESHPGIKGIFLDNVVPDPKADCGGYPAKYPSTSSYTAAQLSFIKAVWAAFHPKGYYVALNGGAYNASDSSYTDGTSTIAWWKQLAPYTNALMNEDYVETSTSTHQLRANGTAWYQEWSGWQRLIGVAQSLGVNWIGLTKQSCTDTTAMTYGKASFLLEWNGTSQSTYFYSCGSGDPWNGAWTTNIGQPTGAKAAVGVGYERSYTNGTVLVNPSPSSSQTFTVNGTGVTLAPTTAKIITG